VVEATSVVERSEIAPTAPRPWLAVWTLCWRELVRFFRQRNRVIGAIGQPIVFWIIFGAGLESTFQLSSGNAAGISYREYFFPGTLMLIVLFTAIFATISVIEDRREGFLQSVLVAPVPRWAMVLGKVLGGTAIAMIQGLIFLLLGLTLDIPFSPLQLAAVMGHLFVVGIGLTSLGFWIAWRINSTQGYHAIMSVVLFPMWLLSGAFFPAGDNWLGYVIRVNPLTYATAGLRRLLYLGATDEVRAAALPDGLPSAWTCAIVTVGATVLAFWLACRVSARRTKGDLL